MPSDQNATLINYHNTYLTNEQAQTFLSNISPPKDLTCPITLTIFHDPVIALGDGQTYERHAISTWFQSQRNGGRSVRSPVTNSYMEGDVVNLVANKAVADMARHYRERIGKQLCLHVQAISGSSSNLDGGDGGFRIRNLVEMGADLSVKAANGNTAFMALVQKGQFGLIQFFLSLDLPLTNVNEEGLGCVDFIQREIRQGGSSEWTEILHSVQEKIQVEIANKLQQEQARDENNARQRERQRVFADEARNTAAMNRNGTVINGTLIQNGLGSLEEGYGHFPSLLALQFQGNIPLPSASFAEVEHRERKRLDEILKWVGGLVLIFWLLA